MVAVLVALVALTKPRLACFSVLTALAAYGAVRAAPPAAGHLALVLMGTTLAAGGALSFNQWWERAADALMRRTAGRPLPRATIAPAGALAWSLLLSGGGVACLAIGINHAAALVAAATIVIYGLMYTPLKRRTRWATEVGAVSGALPPLLGAAAAGDFLARPAWVLAAILLCWQMPHFFAIGWMHRDDYRAAGFPLLPAVDAVGKRTAAWSLGYTVLLVMTSLIPWVAGWFGPIYGIPAGLAGAAFGWRAWCWWQADTAGRDSAARSLFVGSILYLPLLLGALLFEQLFR